MDIKEIVFEWFNNNRQLKGAAAINAAKHEFPKLELNVVAGFYRQWFRAQVSPFPLEAAKAGHGIRRKGWAPGLYIRMVNAQRIHDEQLKVMQNRSAGTAGNAPLMFGRSDGYLYHLGQSNGGKGSGLQFDLFATDWEDIGYISSEEFKLTQKRNRELRNGNRSASRSSAGFC